MGLCSSREEDARNAIARKIKKANVMELNIDSLFAVAYSNQPVPYYNGYTFEAHRLEERVPLNYHHVQELASPKIMQIEETKLHDFILENITDINTSKTWKALNLIGYYGDLGSYVKSLPDDLQTKCRSILLSHFQGRDYTLLDTRYFAFLYA